MTPSEISKQVNMACDIARPGIIQILSSIVIGNGKVIASDIDSQISIDAPFDFDSYAVPSSKFKGILSTLDQSKDLSLTEKSGKLSIKSGKSKFTCQTLSPESFPMMELGREILSVVVDQSKLKSMLQCVTHSIPSANQRMILTGALFDFSGECLTIVGCDGNRMAWSAVELESKKHEFVIPRASISKIIKILSTGDVEVKFYDGKAKFTCNGIELAVKLQIGKYPDYKRIIPLPNGEFSIDRKLFIDAISRASTALDKNRSATIKISRELEIECINSGEISSDSVECDWVGDEMAFGMNPDYLREILSVMQSDDVFIGLSDQKSAWLIQDKAGIYSIIMPLRN